MTISRAIQAAEERLAAAQAHLEAISSLAGQDTPALILAYFEAVALEDYTLSHAINLTLEERAKEGSMLARAFVSQLADY